MEALEIINTVGILVIGVYSILMTRRIELLKSKLDVSTTSEKWLISEQNKALIELSKKYFDIIDKFYTFPDYNDDISDFINRDGPDIENVLNIGQSNVAFIRILFNDDELLKAIMRYVDVMMYVASERKAVLAELKIKKKTQIPGDDYKKIEQINEFAEIFGKYLNFCTEKLYTTEWEDYIRIVQKHLLRSR